MYQQAGQQSMTGNMNYPQQGMNFGQQGMNGGMGYGQQSMFGMNGNMGHGQQGMSGGSKVHYAGHEEANDMIFRGELGTREMANSADQRYQQFGGQGPGTQFAVPQLSYEQLQKEYLGRLPKAYGQPIVAVSKGDRGNIKAFQLANGNILDYPQIIQAGLDGALEGLLVQGNREGELIVRSAPDGYRSNNLDNLPEFQ